MRRARLVRSAWQIYHAPGQGGRCAGRYFSVLYVSNRRRTARNLPAAGKTFRSERCRSGRTGWFRKPVRGQLLPGFESLSLRQPMQPLAQQSVAVFMGTMWAQVFGPNGLLRDQNGRSLRRKPFPFSLAHPCLHHFRRPGNTPPDAHKPEERVSHRPRVTISACPPPAFMPIAP